MIQFIITLIGFHVFSNYQVLYSCYDIIRLAWESGEAQHLSQELVVSKGFASFHGFYDCGVNLVLSVLEYLVMNVVRILSGFFLLDCVDLYPSHLGLELAVDCKFVIFADGFLEALGLGQHYWFICFLWAVYHLYGCNIVNEE